MDLLNTKIISAGFYESDYRYEISNLKTINSMFYLRNQAI